MVPWWLIPITAWVSAGVMVVTMALLNAAGSYEDDEPDGTYVDDDGEVIG